MQDNLKNLLQNSEQRCLEAGLCLTKKREQVLNLMFIKNQALSAYEIVDAYRQHYQQKVSAVSIYRILDFLMQAGLVHKLQRNHQYLACAHIACTHRHQTPQFLICDTCHRVEELGIGKKLATELKSNIVPSHFDFSPQQLELHGTCQLCQQQ